MTTEALINKNKYLLAYTRNLAKKVLPELEEYHEFVYNFVRIMYRPDLKN